MSTHPRRPRQSSVDPCCNRFRRMHRSRRFWLALLVAGLAFCAWCVPAGAGNLAEVIQSGKLRHLGIPYANFVSKNGDGLDVELIQRFAEYLGVEYEFVESTWGRIIPDLTGKTIAIDANAVTVTGSQAVRGDLICTGFTVLPWREQIVDFASATFPTGVWLIARADLDIEPISPAGDIEKDIQAVKAMLSGRRVLALKDSCLDPQLYQLEETGASIQLLSPQRNLDEMIPMVIAGISDTTLMDVPVALVALEQWPGEIKVVGPVSAQQAMAPAFAKSSKDLRDAFETFFSKCKSDGTYHQLVKKYYPTVFTYYPDFF